jgi:hypothetical protein
VVARLDRDLREAFVADAGLSLVFDPGTAEVLRGHRRLGVPALHVGHERVERAVDAWAVGERRCERARKHLFETDRERDVDDAACYGLPREKERCRSGRAGVVHVDDRNPGDSQLVERLLARRRVADHESHVGLLDFAVVDAGVGQRLARGVDRHRVVGGAASGLGELHHADSCDACLVRHWAISVDFVP